MVRVSVIKGVYNCKDFLLLKKSIDSIIKQTFTDWEFIICDDSSTNDMLYYLNEAAQSETRIKVISYQRNKGLAYALNQLSRHPQPSISPVRMTMIFSN